MVTSISIFPDLRLSKRFSILCHQLGQNYRQSIPQAAGSKGQMKAAYRFLGNTGVVPKQLIHAKYDQLEAALSSCHTPILCISDTTELDYSKKRGADRLGPMTSKLRRGMFAHTSMLVGQKGVPLGLLNQSFVVRQQDYFGKSDERKYWPIERKESYRWLSDFQLMQQWSRFHRREMIFVADREADLMEIFHARNSPQAHFVIRSQFNRCTINPNEKLYELLEKQEFVHTYNIDIAHPKTRKKRTATLSLRFAPVTIALNQSSAKLKVKKHLSPVCMFAVEVRELDPPTDIDDPIRWVLLTSLAVHQIAEALQVIDIYVKRWVIERFFYLLKSGGAQVEELQLESPQALQNAVTLYSTVIMEAMKIKYAAQQKPDSPISELGISNQVCQILYSYVNRYTSTPLMFNPQKPPNAWEFCRVLGMLGGFIPSKQRPLPGLKILARSLEQLSTILKAHELFNEKDKSP